jgi:hypothetical protein
MLWKNWNLGKIKTSSMGENSQITGVKDNISQKEENIYTKISF